MYIKINGKSTHYNASFEPFTTQHGYRAIRFIGDQIPNTSKGFKAYDDDGTVLYDLSAYTHVYKPNEFSVKEDIIDGPSAYNAPLGPSAYEVLNNKINRVNNRVSQITPYTDTKVGYYGETSKTFYDAPEGNTLVFFDNYNGNYSTERVENRLIVTFDALEQATKITISVQ